VFQKTDNWREPVGQFVVEQYGDLTFEAATEVALLPGFSAVYDSDFAARIKNNYCVPHFSGMRLAGSGSPPMVIRFTNQVVNAHTLEMTDQDTLKSKLLNVWPNPSPTTTYNYTLPFTVIEQDSYLLLVIDTNGQQVLDQTMTKDQTQIYLPDLAPGIYIIQLIHNNEKYQQKLLVY
jgi:hypothetical protein